MVNDVKVPLARPTITEELFAEYIDALREIFENGRLTLGKYTQLFEEHLARVLGLDPDRVVAVNSATSALHAVMMALGIGPGDEVLVPTYTFASTVNAPIYVGAKPVLVDSDPETFNISVDDLLEKITPRTKAIIPVHIGGVPADLKALTEIAEDHKLYLIEDAAHALGSYYMGKPCGTFGTAGVYSFYPNKIITTGEGGAVVTKDASLADKLRVIRCVGRKGLGPTDVIMLGHNFRMSELQAALGYLQLKFLDKLLENRRRIAEYYFNNLSKINGIELQKIPPGSQSSYYAFIIKIDEDITGMRRDQVVHALREQYGIETTILYKPIHQHPYYRKILGEIKGLEIAEMLGKTTLALPIFGHMKLSEAEYVSFALKTLLEQQPLLD